MTWYREGNAGPRPRCYVIAEVGVNHEGSFSNCVLMVEEAARAGADAVKLQTIDADENYLPGTESHQIFSQSALTREETAQIFDLARSLGMEPFTTTGDRYSLDWVLELNPCAVKISSGLLTHLPLIRDAASRGLPMIISTGMAKAEEIDAAVQAARDSGVDNLALLQCTSIYPAEPKDLHLSRISWLRDRYRVVAGFSDHHAGILAAPLAVAAGARVIEKHISLTPKRAGFDHRVSVDPRNFSKMVRRIREAEAMMGTPERSLPGIEQENATRFHRIIVARRSLVAGHPIGVDDIGFRRPRPGLTGLPPSFYDEVLGRALRRPLNENEPITLEDLRSS
jgi:sialic acid synthase SpsE